MTYTKLPVLEFGQQLLKTQDLDPVYVTLYDAKLDEAYLKRWLVAYWCSYNMGFSSWAAERKDKDFWGAMHVWAENKVLTPINTRWPRGRERRHFRGLAGIESIVWLSKTFPHPEAIVDMLCDGPLNYPSLLKRILTLPLFGPWIAYKIGDMLERVMLVPVDFTDTAIFMFKEPYEAALKVHEYENGKTEIPNNHKVISVVNQLTTQLQGYYAPPVYNRLVGAQEVETVLCKWKSHQNGHYPIGIDTHEIKVALQQWAPVSIIAQHMTGTVPNAH